MVEDKLRNLDWLSFTTFVVGDLATTLYALSELSHLIVESNSFVFGVINAFGLWILIPLKLGVFIGCYGVYRKINHPFSYVIPISLSVMGVVITLSNLYLIIQVI